MRFARFCVLALYPPSLLFPSLPPPALQEWESRGGQTWQCIEPVDGFHPNQNAQPLVTDVFWQLMTNNFSQYLPPINPNNAAIQNMFGDQGGY